MDAAKALLNRRMQVRPGVPPRGPGRRWTPPRPCSTAGCRCGPLPSAPPGPPERPPEGRRSCRGDGVRRHFLPRPTLPRHRRAFLPFRRGGPGRRNCISPAAEMGTGADGQRPPRAAAAGQAEGRAAADGHVPLPGLAEQPHPHQRGASGRSGPTGRGTDLHPPVSIIPVPPTQIEEHPADGTELITRTFNMLIVPRDWRVSCTVPAEAVEEGLGLGALQVQ